MVKWHSARIRLSCCLLLRINRTRWIDNGFLLIRLVVALLIFFPTENELFIIFFRYRMNWLNVSHSISSYFRTQINILGNISSNGDQNKILLHIWFGQSFLLLCLWRKKKLMQMNSNLRTSSWRSIKNEFYSSVILHSYTALYVVMQLTFPASSK